MKNWLPAMFALSVIVTNGQMVCARSAITLECSGHALAVSAGLNNSGGKSSEGENVSNIVNFEKLPFVSVRHTINAPLAKVWESWNDFGGVYKFHPALRHSQLLPGSPAGGVGCSRQCDMKDGKNWVRERIVASVPEKSQIIDVYDSTMPLKRARASLELVSVNPEATEVQMTIRFEPKMGFLGKLMVPMMKRQFKKMLTAVLLANDAFVSHGVLANE